MKYRVLKWEGNLGESGGPSDVDCWSDRGEVDADTEQEAIRLASADIAEYHKDGAYAVVPAEQFRRHKAELTVDVE